VSIVKKVQLQGSNGEKFGYAGSPFAYKDKIITNSVNGEVYVSDSLGNVNLIPITANSISNIHDTLVACDWMGRKFKYSNDGIVWIDYTSFTLPTSADGQYPILENGLSLQGYSPSVSIFDYRKGLALGEMNADSIGNLSGMADIYPLVVDSTIYIYNNNNKGVFKNSLRNLIK
jgi:hypothetical protein